MVIHTEMYLMKEPEAEGSQRQRCCDGSSLEDQTMSNICSIQHYMQKVDRL